MIPPNLEAALAQADDPNGDPIVQVISGVGWMSAAGLVISACMASAVSRFAPHINPIVPDLFAVGLTPLLTLAVVARGVAIRQFERARDADPRVDKLRSLLALAREVAHEATEWERRRHLAVSQEAWRAGKLRIDVLTASVARDLRAADQRTSAPGQIGRVVGEIDTITTPRDLAAVREINDDIAWTGLAPIRLPPSVVATLDVLPSRWGLVAMPYQLARGVARWVWVTLLSALVLAAEGFDSFLAAYRDRPDLAPDGLLVLGVGAAMFSLWRTPRPALNPWYAPLAARGDPRFGAACLAIGSLEHNRYVNVYNDEIADGDQKLDERLAQERRLRRRVARLAASIEELGPLGYVGADTLARHHAHTGFELDR